MQIAKLFGLFTNTKNGNCKAFCVTKKCKSTCNFKAFALRANANIKTQAIAKLFAFYVSRKRNKTWIIFRLKVKRWLFLSNLKFFFIYECELYASVLECASSCQPNNGQWFFLQFVYQFFQYIHLDIFKETKLLWENWLYFS